MEKRGMWGSRLTFILAAVGSAVGLGNAWRFPGLAAKHGGGTFLVVYLLAMLVMGIPLLMMEISVSRKFRRGAIESMRGIGKKWEFVGWAATSNAFVIVCYYSVVFAWVILMFVNSWQFAGMTGNNEAAAGLFSQLTQTTGAVEGYNIPGIALVCLLVAWGLIFYCIRNGAKSVGKVVKFTVFAPVILLLIMAVKGCTMPGAMDGIKMLFVPDPSAFSDPTLWVDAIGQVFYSLSIMMAIMFAYGSYVGDDADIAADAMIIAFSDMAVSVLSGIVMFSTMGGTGMLGDITASGIGTAFFVYPTAIVNLTGIGWLNAAAGRSCMARYRGQLGKLGQPDSDRRARVHRHRLDVQPPQGARRGQQKREALQDALRLVRGFHQVRVPRSAGRALYMEYDQPVRHQRRQLRRLSHLGTGHRGLGCFRSGICERLYRKGGYRGKEEERLCRGRDRLERLSYPHKMKNRFRLEAVPFLICEKQMLDQNFHAHDDEDDAADQLCL